MPPQLVHGDGGIAAKICKFRMGKLRHVLGSPNSWPSTTAPLRGGKGVVRRGEGL